MKYKYMCINCGDLICELTTTFEMSLPMKCPGDRKNSGWTLIFEGEMKMPEHNDFDYETFRSSLIEDGYTEKEIDVWESKLLKYFNAMGDCEKDIKELQDAIGADPKGWAGAFKDWIKKRRETTEENVVRKE